MFQCQQHQSIPSILFSVYYTEDVILMKFLFCAERNIYSTNHFYYQNMTFISVTGHYGNWTDN